MALCSSFLRVAWTTKAWIASLDRLSAIGAEHCLWCCSSPDGETTAPCFSEIFPELNNFSSIFSLSYDYVFHVCVVVFLTTTKSQLFSQVFEVDIGQDLSIKITQLTFFPQGWLFLLNTKSRNNVLKQFFEHILYLFSSFRRKPFENCPGKIINQS